MPVSPFYLHIHGKFLTIAPVVRFHFSECIERRKEKNFSLSNKPFVMLNALKTLCEDSLSQGILNKNVLTTFSLPFI